MRLPLQLQDSITERDVCSLVLSVDVWIDKTLVNEGFTASAFTEDQIAPEDVPIASDPLSADVPQVEERRFKTDPGIPSAAMNDDRAPFNTVSNPSAGGQKQAMSDMCRVRQCVER